MFTQARFIQWSIHRKGDGAFQKIRGWLSRNKGSVVQRNGYKQDMDLQTVFKKIGQLVFLGNGLVVQGYRCINSIRMIV